MLVLGPSTVYLRKGVGLKDHVGIAAQRVGRNLYWGSGSLSALSSLQVGGTSGGIGEGR